MEPPKSGAGSWYHQNQAPRDGTTKLRRWEMEPLKSGAGRWNHENQAPEDGTTKIRHQEMEPPKTGACMEMEALKSGA